MQARRERLEFTWHDAIETRTRSYDVEVEVDYDVREPEDLYRGEEYVEVAQIRFCAASVTTENGSSARLVDLSPEFRQHLASKFDAAYPDIHHDCQRDLKAKD